MRRTSFGPARVVSVIAMGRGTTSMSQIFKAILATLAVSATFSTVQLASGHDLIGHRQFASSEPAGEINRAAKAVHAALKTAPSRTDTIPFRTVGPHHT